MSLIFHRLIPIKFHGFTYFGHTYPIKLGGIGMSTDGEVIARLPGHGITAFVPIPSAAALQNSAVQDQPQYRRLSICTY